MPIAARCPNCGAPGFDAWSGRCTVCLWQTAQGVYLAPSTGRDLIYSEISDGALIFCAVLSVVAILAWLVVPVIMVVRGANPLYLLLSLIGAIQGFGTFVLFARVLDLNRQDYRLHAASKIGASPATPQSHKRHWFHRHRGT
jgi:hypothetical protein